MERILVNASASREGGARTILEKFCASIQDHNKFYVILSPIQPKIMPPNSKWVKVETFGLMTLLFSLIFSWFYYFRYQCKTIISFTNINTVLPARNRITYFHNLLICTDDNIKYKILRCVLKVQLKFKITIIFQTEYVYSLFRCNVSDVSNYSIKWPGLNLDILKFKDFNVDDYLKEKYNIDGDCILVPITNISNKNKNFDLVKEIAKENTNINFIVLDNNYDICLENVFFIGYQAQEEIYKIIRMSNGVLISSYFETICLPIFESLTLNRPAFVLDRDYISSLESQFNGLNGLLKFSDVNDLCLKFEDIKKYSKHDFFDNKLMKGQWDF